MLTVSEPRAWDAALVRAAKNGDRAAFGMLYERYVRMIHGILLVHVPYADAEDLVQTVFVRAMEQIATLRDEGAFGAWLCSIARHGAASYLRHRRETSVDLECVQGGQRPDGAAFQVLAVLRQLPEAYRETLSLRLIEGFTGPEIAMRVSLTPESIRVNLCRGMKMLRERLGEKRE